MNKTINNFEYIMKQLVHEHTNHVEPVLLAAEGNCVMGDMN